MKNVAEQTIDLNSASGWILKGTVIALKGGLIYAKIPGVACGDRCSVTRRDATELDCVVVSFQDGLVTLSPLGSIVGVYPGGQVQASSREFLINIPAYPLGCILDCFGKVIRHMNGSDRPLSLRGQVLRLHNPPPSPLERGILSEHFSTGVRVLDGLCTVARGQRIGLFAEAGVGKSTLLGMIARSADVDAIVVGLIGERGREVNEFIEQCLGDIQSKVVVVVATSDEAPARRAMASFTATAVAESLRDEGRNVLLLCDSLTRMARAQREIGIAAGELPVQKGYPPSVFGELPRLLERAGLNRNGSITAFYTILVESERIDSDPLGEEIKSLLDGHVYLSHQIASLGVRPAVHVSRSLSRVFERIVAPEHNRVAVRFRRLMSRLERDRDLVLLGGAPDPELVEALSLESKLLGYINQDQFHQSDFHDAEKLLVDLFS
jgi:FliI/YscN family ATPase